MELKSGSNTLLWAWVWLLVALTWIAGIAGGVWLVLHDHPWPGVLIAVMALSVGVTRAKEASPPMTKDPNKGET